MAIAPVFESNTIAQQFDTVAANIMDIRTKFLFEFEGSIESNKSKRLEVAVTIDDAETRREFASLARQIAAMEQRIVNAAKQCKETHAQLRGVVARMQAQKESEVTS